MRIAAVSDIHARIGGIDDGLVAAIRARVEEIDPDIFIIAGDISEKIADLERNLDKLALSSSTNLYVAGNHDIWFEENPPLGSLEKYSTAIGDVCKKAGFIHLPDEFHVDGTTAFVGTVGWYDYSFRRTDLDIPLSSYTEKQWKDAVWRDYYSIDWPYTDAEATNLFNSKLEYDLETLPDDIDRVVFVSHHLPFQDLTLYKDYLPWDFFSAFMGASSTGEILKRDGRVVLSFSGHSHVRNKINVNGITALTVPIGYGRPLDDDFESLVDDAVAVLELGESGIEIEHFVEGDICENLPYVF